MGNCNGRNTQGGSDEFLLVATYLMTTTESRLSNNDVVVKWWLINNYGGDNCIDNDNSVMQARKASFLLSLFQPYMNLGLVTSSDASPSQHGEYMCGCCLSGSGGGCQKGVVLCWFTYHVES